MMMHQKPQAHDLVNTIAREPATGMPQAQVNNSSSYTSSISTINSSTSSTHAEADDYYKMVAASYHRQSQAVNDSGRAPFGVSRVIDSIQYPRNSFSRLASLGTSSCQSTATAALPLGSTATTNPINTDLNARIQSSRNRMLVDMLLTTAPPFVASNQLLSADVSRGFDVFCSGPTSEDNTVGGASLFASARSLTSGGHQPSDASRAAALRYESQLELLLSARKHRPMLARLPRLLTLQHCMMATSTLSPSLRTDRIGRLPSPFDHTESANFDGVPSHPRRSEKTDATPSLASIATTISAHSKAAILSSAVDALSAMTPSTNNLSSRAYSRQHRVFPAVLHRALRTIGNTAQGAAIAGFLPGGKAFAIRNQFLFEQKVLPVFFPKMKNFASFQRQLNLYSFKRLGDWGIDRGVVYCHNMFVCEIPLMAGTMKRTKIKGVRRRGKPATKQKEMQA